MRIELMNGSVEDTRNVLVASVKKEELNEDTYLKYCNLFLKEKLEPLVEGKCSYHVLCMTINNIQPEVLYNLRLETQKVLLLKDIVSSFKELEILLNEDDVYILICQLAEREPIHENTILEP